MNSHRNSVAIHHPAQFSLGRSLILALLPAFFLGNKVLGANGARDSGLSYQIDGGTGLEVLSSRNLVSALHTAGSLG